MHRGLCLPQYQKELSKEGFSQILMPCRAVQLGQISVSWGRWGQSSDPCVRDWDQKEMKRLGDTKLQTSKLEPRWMRCLPDRSESPVGHQTPVVLHDSLQEGGKLLSHTSSHLWQTQPQYVWCGLMTLVSSYWIYNSEMLVVSIIISAISLHKVIGHLPDFQLSAVNSWPWSQWHPPAFGDLLEFITHDECLLSKVFREALGSKCLICTELHSSLWGF